MRRTAFLAAVLALPLTLAVPASAGVLREACWSFVPTFRVSGLVCRLVPVEDPWETTP